MATMFPRYLKTDKELEAAGLSAISSAERRLFDVFRKNLSDDYTVFHGVLMQVPRTRTQGGGVSDREIDFLIAHPQYGLLTIEVKGGLVRLDGATGEWTSKDRHGQTHDIKDPVQQIRQACYDLNKLLQREEALRSFDYTTWYAVALPDVDVEDALGPGAPRAIILDRNNTHPNQVEKSIEGIFRYYQKQGQQPLGSKGIKALSRKIAPTWFLRTHLATDFNFEEDRFNQLTVQQYAVLEFIEDKPRAMIAGCAGSGKTMLAIEKVRRLSQQQKRVLFTCYNKTLAEWLSEVCDLDYVTVQHFHSLARTVTSDSGKPLKWMSELGVDADEYWTNTVPSALFEAAADLPEYQRYDAIVVDEGQDFKSTYWEAIQMLLKDPDNGILYIFYDDSQRLYSDDSFPLPEPAGRLNRNLRSTHEIGEKVAEYFQGIGQVIPAGPVSGRKIESVKLEKYTSPQEALEDVLSMLQDENVSLQDVVLLTPLGEEKSIWKHKMDIGDYQLVRSGKIKGNRVLTSTIHGFKGLERPVVILSELDYKDTEETPQLLYVALSRAKNHVIVLGQLPE